MPQPGSARFYRDQAERLTYLAVGTANAEVRLELLEIAASFRKLADYASANSASAMDGKGPIRQRA